MTTHRFRLTIFLIVIILTLAGSASIFSTIITFRNIPFPWDSAGHAYEGLRIAQDLKAGDIISFLADTYRQAFWPFFHSWLLAPAFILFGNTYAVARIVSLFCFILSVLVLYLIGTEMSEKQGHWIGLITACLALTSLPFLVLSAMCMSEIPGLLMTFLTILLYLKAIRRGKPYLFIFTGILMALTLFTKWHHGVFLIPAILLTQLANDRHILSRSNFCLLIPFSALIIAWFIYPKHILSFYEHSTFQPHFYTFLSLENLLFYPKSFFSVYHSSLLFAIPIAMAFVYSLRNIREPKVMLFATHVLIGIILLTIKLDNRHRYIITMVPSIWLLGAGQLVESAFYFGNRLNNKIIKIAFASIVIVAFSMTSFSSVAKVYNKFPHSLLNYNYFGDEKPNKAYQFISENVAGHKHIAIFGSWDYYNSLKSSTIRWHIQVGRENDVTHINSNKRKANYYFYQFLKNRDSQSYYDFMHFLENKDVRVDEYHLLSFMKFLNERAYSHYRREKSLNPFSDKITDVTSMDPEISFLITVCKEDEKELNYFAQLFFLNQTQWDRVLMKKFADLGITITMYERKVASEAIQM